ncbi:tetratricopeptide repeat protein [Pseudomarimonas arenosa]|uniref:Tetratricopeptide repeat protein n=1 Tax=Pseudomarimonas arenosa TaxID=2774145 RepID=A0AAW3ZR15_9GAMM|nr:tetratricopeptide repeat protein [Pseudomarimonas arenosa]MBD8528158.1 tetratricopeptide repeat protein [Pseudomarimonas arenosa]
MNRRSRQSRRSLALVLLVGAVSAGCLAALTGCADESAASPLATVEAPPDLAGLDRSVQQQFSELWFRDGDLESPIAPAERRNWGELGLWFHAYRYHHSATKCYENAVLLDPDNPRWHYYLGLIALDSGAAATARGHFERALERAPKAAHVLTRLADLSVMEGDLAGAESLYRQVLSIDQHDAAARFGLGQVALQHNDVHQALAWLEALHAEQPQATEVIYALASAWRMLGESEKAAALLSAIPASNVHQVSLARKDPWSKALVSADQGSRQLTRKAVSAANQGRTGEAAALFGAAVVRDPEGPEERINYALALARLGRHKDALDQIERALQLAPTGSGIHIKARLEHGRLLAEAGRLKEAESVLQRLTIEHPAESAAFTELSRLLHSRGDLTGAVQAYTALRQLDAAGPDVMFWHSAALLALEQHDSARTQLEQDLAGWVGDQRRLRLLWVRSVALQAADEPSPLQAAWQVVDRGAVHSVFLAETAAMLHAGQSDFDSAMAWQRAAVDALAKAGLNAPLRIARRRLVLYQEQKRPTSAWDKAERPIDLELPAAVVADLPFPSSR